MRKYSVLLQLLILSCSLMGQGIISVQKVGDMPLKTSDGLFIYALPQTVLAFKVVTKKTSVFCGPYFAYAEEYLGIKGVPTENTVEWQIDSIDIKAINDIDPDEFYAIKTGKGFNPDPLFELTRSGFILDPSFQQIQSIDNPGVIPKSKKSGSGFEEYSMQNYYHEKADTIFKTVLKDSLCLKIPVVKPKTELKNLKDKAREAADVIIKVRQRRYEMIMSEDEALPEVNSFKTDLAELRKIEDDYINLFTGRYVTESTVSWFYYTPIYNTRETQFEVFRFSTKYGITDRTVPLATPVFLTFEKEHRTKAVNDWFLNSPHPGENHLLYRIPDAAMVNVIWKGDLLASKKVLIYQYGTVVPYPVWGKK
jgi:hypothetical protein